MRLPRALSLENPLGDGWLGALIAAVSAAIVGGFGGWVAGRRAEKARIAELAESAFRLVIESLAGEVERLGKAHERCEGRLDEALSRIEQVEGELRQEKQIHASASRVRE